MKTIFNALGFQAVWWSLVLSASQGFDLVGCAIAAGFLLLHFLWVASADRAAEARFVLRVAALGWVIDTILAKLGFVSFGARAVAPMWLMFMWLGFACTLHFSLSRIMARPFLAGVLGAIFGPLSYGVGTAFGLLVFADRTQSLIVYGVFWGVLMLGLGLYIKWEKKNSAKPSRII